MSAFHLFSQLFIFMCAHACKCTNYGRWSYIFPRSQSGKVKYIPMPKGLEAYSEDDYCLKTLFLLNTSHFCECVST